MHIFIILFHTLPQRNKIETLPRNSAPPPRQGLNRDKDIRPRLHYNAARPTPSTPENAVIPYLKLTSVYTIT